ncbi:VCBS repeat-containing protein [bacterium]|nr:VCBS repeat-containing protein [bacterium]
MKRLTVVLFLIILVSVVFAQEVKTIDSAGNGDYLTITQGINYINSLTEFPDGGIVLNILANQSFTENLPAITAVASEASPIVIQKSGEGQRPIIFNETTDNIVFNLSSASYITISGIHIKDPDITNEDNYLTGFLLDASSHINIRDCVVQDFNKFGIKTASATTNISITDNDLFYSDNFYTSETTVYGIQIAYNSGAENAEVLRNRVHGIKESSATIYGIDFNQVTGILANNMVSLPYDNNDKVFGLRVVGRADRSIECYYNTVYLAGTATDQGYAINISGGAGDVIVKNNIFVNNRSGIEQYSIWYSFQQPGVELDNNIYYSESQTGFYGRLVAVEYLDLSAWQTEINMDGLSQVVAPEFISVSEGDLHLSGTSLGNQDFIASPIEGVSDDFDGDMRHASYPYVGADEDLEHPLVTLLESEYVIDNTGNGDFITIENAILALNSGLIPEGGITFNILAGQIYTDSLSAITAIGDENSPILFQKSGQGANPLIDYNYLEGSVVEFNGAQYITFDSIDITDSNDDEVKYDRAYYIYASNNITIQNCNISNFGNYGVHIRDASQNNTIHQNNIYYTSEYFTPEASVYGIYVQYNSEADNAVISNNHIYGLKEATANIYAIRVQKVSADVINNFISVTEDNNDKVFGLRLDAGNSAMTLNVYNNTVLLAGAGTDHDYCVQKTGTDGIINLKNNLFINRRSGDYDHLIISYTFGSGTWNADNNAYYSENGSIGYWINTECADLETWQTTSSTDMNTSSFDAEFVSDYDLHLSGTSLGEFALAGIPIEGVEYDIDGELRHLVNPYKGADENLEFPLNPEDQYAITVSPLTLDYGTVYAGSEVETQVFNILNSGIMNISVSSIEGNQNFILRINDGDWQETLNDITIEPAMTLNVEVKYTNDEVAEQSDIISINSNAIENPLVEVSVLANSIQAAFTTNSSEITFPVTVNNLPSFRETIILTNENDMPFLINNITVSGDFYLAYNDSSDLVLLEDIFLEDSLEIEVYMLSQESGIHNGEITFYSQLVHNVDEGTTIPLSGESYNFGFQDIEAGMIGFWQSETEAGDYDNDGDYDILATGYILDSSTSAIAIYSNDGNGDFERINIGLQGTGFGCVDWIDLDNDNDLDIYTAGQYQQDNYISKIYVNEDGQYTEVETNLPALKGSNTDWKDFNGDGLLDVLYTGVLDHEVGDIDYTRIYINQGNYQFEMLTPPIHQVSSGDAKFADYNNDGLLDIATAGRVDSWDWRVAVWRNDGNNEFTEIDLGLEGVRYCNIEWADYNNDGLMDLFITGSIQNETPSVLYILRNDGNDTFTNINLPESDNYIVGIRQGDMKIHDLNSDGLLDIIVNGVQNTEWWTGQIHLYQGDDTFTYADSLVALKYGELTMIDYNGDMNSDVLLTGRYDYLDYYCNIYENQTELTNTAPQAPTVLSAEVTDDLVIIEWGMGSDAETPQLGLTYNIKVGSTSGGNQIFSSMATNDGFLLKAHRGNMLNSLACSINNLQNGTYYASVQTIDNSYVGSEFSGEITFEITNGIVSNNSDVVPLISRLNNNYPNPFNPQTTISFDLNKNQHVKLEIYNIKGQKVKSLCNDNLKSGNHKYIWNGRDQNNKQVASGVYFAKMTSPSLNKTQKMILMK